MNGRHPRGDVPTCRHRRRRPTPVRLCASQPGSMVCRNRCGALQASAADILAHAPGLACHTASLTLSRPRRSGLARAAGGRRQVAAAGESAGLPDRRGPSESWASAAHVCVCGSFGGPPRLGWVHPCCAVLLAILPISTPRGAHRCCSVPLRPHQPPLPQTSHHAARDGPQDPGPVRQGLDRQEGGARQEGRCAQEGWHRQDQRRRECGLQEAQGPGLLLTRVGCALPARSRPFRPALRFVSHPQARGGAWSRRWARLTLLTHLAEGAEARSRPLANRGGQSAMHWRRNRRASGGLASWPAPRPAGRPTRVALRSGARTPAID